MSNRLRVLITVDAVGGVWQYGVELARALLACGVDPTLAVLGPPPNATQRQEAAGLRLIETGLPLDWMADDEAAVLRAGNALAALARELSVDLIHVNQPALAAAVMPVPAIVAVHSCVATWWAAVESGPLPPDFAWQTALVRAGLSRAAAVVCPSAAFAQAVRATYFLSIAPRVVHNGRKPLVRAPQHCRDQAFTAGRLWDGGKNVAVLDRAAAALPFPFLAAGPLDGPNGARVDVAHLTALGPLDETAIADQLAARPVFVSAAKYEPFGLAVLEAAQAGCALVLADTPTFRELWGEVAHFVSADDARGFAAAISALIADPDARAAAGKQAQHRGAQFTPAAMAEKTAAIYRETIERKAAA